ncbi:MAG: type II secretion system F family protein [Candidatus Omnitrophica bacterium]|nr:type II secretion system F family protein [Candidatus Omnitrophota bacterium]
MIIFFCILAFFSVLFLTLSASNMIHGSQDRFYARIAERLNGSARQNSTLPIEKKERLSDLAFFDRILHHVIGVNKLQAVLTQAGLTFTLGTFVLTSLLFGALAFFCGIILQVNLIVAFAGASLFAVFPSFHVYLRRKDRMKKFSSHFPDAIGALASSLRAGYSLQMALESIVSEGGDIVAGEFSQVLSEFEIGKNFEEALKGILNRVDIPELRLFISAVVLQRETGGNLAELLDNLESVIRDRMQLRRELKAATAQARFSGVVLSLLPIFVGIFIMIIHPDYVLFFVRESIGTKLLMGCFLGQVLGFLSIQRIVHIEL